MATVVIIYLVCTGVGTAVALLRPPLMPRYNLLLLIAVVPQIGSLLSIWIPGMFLVSVAAFCMWCLWNRNIAGVLIVAIGVMLNMLVMASYGGAMPIYSDVLAGVGHPLPHGSVMIGSKDVVVRSASLAPLSDWIVLLSGTRTIIASPGDLIAIAGIAYWLLFSHPIKEGDTHDVISRHPRTA
jgi:hypothetical protein